MVLATGLLFWIIIAVGTTYAMVIGAEDRPGEFAIHRLLQVFGIGHQGTRERHQSPPQYMVDLYNSISDSSGITRTYNPYYATVIRSYPDKDTSHHLHFYFNITSNPPEREELLEAEFHIYKLKAKARAIDRISDVRSHLMQVRVYQVMSADSKYKESGNKLLDVRRISAFSYGWEVFYVKTAVLDWLNDRHKNFGLLVTIRTMLGAPVSDTNMRFAKRHQHRSNKQPILVLFSDDGRSKRKSDYPEIDFHTYGYPELSYFSQLPKVPTTSGNELNTTPSVNIASNRNNLTNRTKRSAEELGLLIGVQSTSVAPSTNACGRHELYVDFEKIGWSSWIISPKGYNAYHCKGECSFPLGENQLPTNHATVQSIVHQLELTAGVNTPCCVPNKLYSISLLYFDEHENVILKQYDDMVAASCGCH